MEKILILSFTNHQTDPRVNRQIRLLSNEYQVSAVGLKRLESEQVQFYPITYAPSSVFDLVKRGLTVSFHLYEKAYWQRVGCKENLRLLEVLSQQKFELIIANDIISLPFACRIAGGAKIIFDAHEYYPRDFEDKLWWRLFVQGYVQYLCRRYIKECDRVTTVAERIAEEYKRSFGVVPLVITNACDYYALQPYPVRDDRISMIHHGAAIPSRKIEEMIKLMDYLDSRFSLDLMLVPSVMNYFHRLKLLAKNHPRIRFLDAVKPDNIVPYTNQWDIGLFLLPPTNFNYLYALPNKFFEFIQARLAVAVGPSPEMSSIVKQYDLGVVAKDFSPLSMAAELNRLTSGKIAYYKQQSHRTASELSSAVSMKKLNDLVKEIVTL